MGRGEQKHSRRQRSGAAKKKEQAAKKSQNIIKVKEVKLRPRTEEHDFTVRLKHSKKFLENGDKVKVTIRFRGRELAHQDLGKKQCLRLVEELGDLCIVEMAPKMEGRQMSMILAPNKT